MRNKRMFSLDVVDTDKFLEMPSSCQSLYFHLGMRADDDGFVSSPRKIASMVNCGGDDIRILTSKGYLIPFESGVVVITHWKQNNYLRADRYAPTKHLREKELLLLVNEEYALASLENSGVLPCGIPDSNQAVHPVTETETINICSPEPDERESDFEIIYEIYPKKVGRTKAFGNYCLWLRGKVVNGKRRRLTNKQMYLAVRNYVEQQERAGTDYQYYKNFDTLMGKQLLDYVEEEQHE